MKSSITLFLKLFIVIFALDQLIKFTIINGYGHFDTECISFILVYNKGVAFSMFAFLDENLKYIQLALISGVILYLIKEKELLSNYSLEAGIVIGAGVSNLLDRFTHGGVVDYVYWHCWFDFAVFNFADVMIDLGVLLAIIKSFRLQKQENIHSKV